MNRTMETAAALSKKLAPYIVVLDFIFFKKGNGQYQTFFFFLSEKGSCTRGSPVGSILKVGVKSSNVPKA